MYKILFVSPYNLPPSMTKPRERNFLEAFLQNAEAMIDLATENEATRAVPIIGTAFKIAKGIDDLRSRALAARLAAFVQEPALQSSRAKDLLRESVATGRASGEKIGETLFLVLERTTDLSKPSLLAKVFLAYLDKVISADDLRRIAHVMDISYIDDLLHLLEINGSLADLEHKKLANSFVGTGFSSVSTSVDISDDSTYAEPIFLPLAYTFRMAVAHAESLASESAG